MQCHCVPALPCLICIEKSLGKNTDKVICNFAASRTEIIRLSHVETVSVFPSFFFQTVRLHRTVVYEMLCHGVLKVNLHVSWIVQTCPYRPFYYNCTKPNGGKIALILSI